MTRDCAFQYFDGFTVIADRTNLTLDEAQELWNEHYNDMVKQVKDGFDIEVAIWINMQDEEDFRDTFVHLLAPNVDEDGCLWEKKFYNKF